VAVANCRDTLFLVFFHHENWIRTRRYSAGNDSIERRSSGNGSCFGAAFDRVDQCGQHGRYAREDYRLPELWCLHLYRWTGAFRAGEVTLPVAPGYVSIVPPNLPLSHFFGTGNHSAEHLSCGFRLAGADSMPQVTLPMMADSGASFGMLNAVWEKAIGVFGATPRRAEVLLWDILWRLAEGMIGSGMEGMALQDREPPAVTRTREAIELRLSEPLRVADLARAVDLSHNHLTRLFHEATGKTVVAYLRERRMERATRLLRHTTLPIKQIAAQVGLTGSAPVQQGDTRRDRGFAANSAHGLRGER
jgi:AraC-like DNA-binding protein